MEKLMARDVARHLTQVLEKAGTSIHWVGVVGEDSLATDPSVEWPSGDPIYSIAVQNGFSEGMLVYVYEQKDRYKPEDVRVLLRIKMLCGVRLLMKELPVILEYFENFPEGLKKTA
jgi:hypothetical protein